MYVYIQVIYPKLHLRLPSFLGLAGVETQDFVIARAICRFSCASRTCFCDYQQLQGGLRMRLPGTNSSQLDVAHVALAKIDANYSAVNCSCILLTLLVIAQGVLG